MANVTKIMKLISKIEGSAGRIHLSKKQLELFAKDTNDAQLQKLLSKGQDLSVDIAYKAKSNYSIAGFKVMDGKTKLGTGAVSVTKPGTSNSVVKVRFSAGENGKIAQANGFIDGGKSADAKDAAMSLSRKGGTVEGSISSGEAFAAHVKVNESAYVNGLKTYNADKALRSYASGNNILQRRLDQFMVDARKILRGETGPIKTSEPIKKPDLKLDPDKKIIELKSASARERIVENSFKSMEKIPYPLKLNNPNRYFIDEYGQVVRKKK